MAISKTTASKKTTRTVRQAHGKQSTSNASGKQGKKNEEKISVPRLLRGFKDLMPETEKYWKFVNTTVERIAREYGFSYISTPILEEASVFERTAGESSDIVSKEMFKFNLPKGDEESAGKSVALRPEGTAPIVRAYLEHGMQSEPQPVKLWYEGPMFRYDRPQSGRYRQFHQFGFEVLGDTSPVIDAQIITMIYRLYQALGIDVVFPINNIGDMTCRPAYIEALREYLSEHSRKLAVEDRKRLKVNPLRVLDSKEEETQAVLEEAPQIVDYLSEGCSAHFVSVLEYLDEVEVPYILNTQLVRGLDYYTNTVFEVFAKKEYEEKGLRANALSAGGRYDGLAEALGSEKRSVPGVGFAAGIERTILALRDADVQMPEKQQYDVYVAQLGNEARKKAIKVFDDLRSTGWRVAEGLSKDGLSSQLDRANKLGVQFSIILGQKEILDGTVIIRDMSSGIQEAVNYSKLIPELKKRVEQVKEVNGIRIVTEEEQQRQQDDKPEEEDIADEVPLDLFGDLHEDVYDNQNNKREEVTET